MSNKQKKFINKLCIYVYMPTILMSGKLPKVVERNKKIRQVILPCFFPFLYTSNFVPLFLI